MIDYTFEKLNAYSQLELGAEIYKEIEALKAEHVKKASISVEQKEQSDKEIAELGIKKTEVFNLKQTLDPKTERAKIKELSQSIKQMEKEIKKLLKDRYAFSFSNV